MSVLIKVKQVLKLYDQLDREIAMLRQETSMHCLPGCGHCCTKPAIEATVLEFMPFAFDLYLKRQTQQMREALQTSTQGICQLFAPLVTTGQYQAGKCSQYVHRGLICRLFGYSTTRDKNGQRVLSTCRPIKESQPGAVVHTQSLIGSNQVPGYVPYYQKLVQIDFRLGQEFGPINRSMFRAIEEVEHYYQYRPFPYKHRRLA